MSLVQQTGVRNIVEQWLKPYPCTALEDAPRQRGSCYQIDEAITFKHPLISLCYDAVRTLVPPEWNADWSVVVRAGSGELEWSYGSWWPKARRPATYQGSPADTWMSLHHFYVVDQLNFPLVAFWWRQDLLDVVCRFREDGGGKAAALANGELASPLLSELERVDGFDPFTSVCFPGLEAFTLTRAQVEEGVLDDAIARRMHLFLPPSFAGCGIAGE